MNGERSDEMREGGGFSGGIQWLMQAQGFNGIYGERS
jgi:hypothetical protein